MGSRSPSSTLQQHVMEKVPQAYGCRAPRLALPAGAGKDGHHTGTALGLCLTAAGQEMLVGSVL